MMRELLVKTGPSHKTDSVMVEKTIWHCPNCGSEPVYEEIGEGDYYDGPTHYCVECKHRFSMPWITETPMIEFAK